ncbi:MAG: hypothetical protein HYW49_09510 [Deltaproteobacteria bacterium]|nr:hypothetical protein [Deltaproteobacteria bacterium]
MNPARETRRRRSGQALLEWTIFGLIGFLAWLWVFQAAKQLLDQTYARSLSLFAARKALSLERIPRQPGISIRQTTSRELGQAAVTAGSAAAHSEVRLPARAGRARSSSSSLSFGSLLSLFSE